MTYTINNIAIMIISIFIIGFSTKWWRQAAGSLSLEKLNLLSLSYYALMFLSVLGTILFTIGFRSHHMVRYIRHADTFTQAWLTIMVMILLFPLILKLVEKVSKYSPAEAEKYRKKPLAIKSSKAGFITLTIASIICLGAVLYTFLMIGWEKNAIINMIKGASAEELKLLRSYASSGFPGNQYIKNIFALALTPVLSYISYLYMRETREKRWVILTLVLFLASNLILFYDLEKMPILAYWLMFLMLSIYYGDQIKLRWIIALGVFLAAVIAVMYIFIAKKPVNLLLSISDGPMSRIFFTTPIAYILHLEVFQYRAPLLYGQSMTSWLGRLLGFDTVLRSGSAVMTAVNFTGVKSGYAGVYSGLFLGEAYANFGRWGLFLSMIHVPIVFALVHIIFTRLPKNPFTVALFAYYSMNLLLTLHAGYTDYFFSSIRFIVTFVVLSMLAFSYLFNKLVLAKRESKEGRS